MSAREKRERGLFQLPKFGLVYDHYIPLHELWQSYMLELLGPSFRANVAEPKLLKADLHGAFVTVVQALNPALIGTAGLVLQETQKTFKLITPRHAVKTVPKRGHVFAVDLSFFRAGLTEGALVKPDEDAEPQSHILPREAWLAVRARASDWTQSEGARVVVYGDQFAYRASERATRKFKVNNTIELR